MLYSQGVPLERVGVKRKDGGPVETDGRTIWKLFASNWHLFRGTPSQIWMEHTLETVFGLAEPLTLKNDRPLLRCDVGKARLPRAASACAL